MKIVYPMQLAGEGTPKEIASLDEFISQLNKLNSGTFPIGRNRIWHGGVHLSEKGGWHSSGAVRAIADGEIVAYRFATEPAKATRKSEAGEPEHEIDLYTSPSFCLIRHRYEAGEKNKNSLTFYSLYMHIACENSYSAEPERYVVASNGVPIYKGAAEMQLKAEDKLGVARKGAEIILIDKDNPSVRSNEKNESQPYQLVHYAVPKAGDPELFYIAAKYINAECKTKPNWLIPPESKPARYTVPNNTWLRKTADSTEESTGVPASSEVVLLGEQQMVTINGGLTDFRQVQVFKAGSGTVKNSANQVMANASKDSIGWLTKNKLGAALTAESSIPIEFDKVVLRDSNPIAVQAGEVIGHWGEHQVATLSTSGFSIDPDQKAVHFEVFVGEKDKRDKQEFNDCIQNKAQVTGGQDYLVLNKDKIATYRLINHKEQLSYETLAKFGPLNTPLAVKKTDIVTHGTQKFVRVRERAAGKDELAGEFVLLAGDAELLSQHDWGKLGVKLVDGSNDPDGFLDKEDTEGQEGGVFFSSLYDRLIIDRDNDNVLSGNEIKSALADDDLASKLRQLFIKHESEWIKREKGWPRLEKELAKQPELYKYAMQVHNNMAWVEEVKGLLGGTKMWFIHPAGMMGLVRCKKRGFIFTLDIMKRIYKNFQSNNIKDNELQEIADELNEHIEFYQLDTPLKRTHFFAQILQETGPDLNVIEGGVWRVSAIKSFRGGRTRRYPDGRLYADVHGYVTKTERPRRYIKSDGNDITIDDQIAIVNTIYGNRTELGNGSYSSNDGWNYRGRGLKQVTGKNNYASFNDWHKKNQSKWPEDTINAVDNFEILSEIKFATRSAAWFWISNSSNENPDSRAKCFDYANEASDAAVDRITNIINLNTDSRQKRKDNFWRLWNDEVLHD